MGAGVAKELIQGGIGQSRQRTVSQQKARPERAALR
jgi:hypothetical protein